MEPEVNIRELLEKIKREGIAEADRTSEAILARARSEAATIVRDAKKEAETILSLAAEEVQRRRKAFEQELSQAGRNLLLGVRQEIIHLLDRILSREVHASLGPEFIQGLIHKMIDKWTLNENSTQMEILLSEADCRALEEAALQSLRNELKKGILLKPAPSVRAGFRVGERDGDFHYDLTDRGIAELLTDYLNPRVARFLAAAQGDEEEEA